MKAAISLATVGLLLSAATPAAAVAAPEDPVVLPVDAVVTEAHPEVTVTVTVPTSMVGLDLQPEDFYVSEAGEPRQVTVTQLPAEELQVVLVLDTSGSMRGAPLAAAEQAARSFIAAMPAGVQIAMVRFGDIAEVVAPFTDDHEALAETAGGMVARGETALYDGLVLAAGLFEGSTASRRTILLLSDGGDTVSEASVETSLVGLLASEARFVAVELQSPENDSATMRRLEAATEGRLVPASDPAALGSIFSEIASDLVNQYELRFTSELGGRVELIVAARRGDVSAVGSVLVRFPELAPVAPQDPVVVTVAPAPDRIVAPAPQPVAVSIPWIATGAGLLVGAAAVFTSLVIAGLLIPTRRGSSLAFFGLIGRRPGGDRLSGFASRATLMAEEALAGHGGGRIRVSLDRAGLRVREGELALLLVAGALVSFLAVNLFYGPALGAAAAAGVLALALGLLQAAGKRRCDAFRAQLPDTLQLISGSLRAGFGLNQAIAAVAAEQDDPAGSEFARVQLETQLGRSIEDGLRGAARRVDSEDLPWVADAIEIHRETGGDVADLLDSISNTVRERERVRGQIKVLSAEGRMSGTVLVLMPFGLAAITFAIAPGYLAELTDTTPGRVMIGVGLALMVVGIAWIRRIVRLEY